MNAKITTFNIRPGRLIGRSYVVEGRLGGGSEGEVYRIRDRMTGIHRAAKIYFPHSDPRSRLAVRHALKLDHLRSCPIVLHYHHSEQIQIGKHQALALISELCDGIPLQDWLSRHRGGRVNPHVATTILYALAAGLEDIHAMGEYHGDVHEENILIRQVGINFELKLVDFYGMGRPTRTKRQEDIYHCVRVFHQLLGGAAHYPKLPDALKYICAALRFPLVVKRFPTMDALRRHLEIFDSNGVW